MPEPFVLQSKASSMQACVPESYTDDDVAAFARFCRAEAWQIRIEDPSIDNDSVHVQFPFYQVRVPCELKAGYVHIVLDY